MPQQLLSPCLPPPPFRAASPSLVPRLAFGRPPVSHCMETLWPWIFQGVHVWDFLSKFPPRAATIPSIHRIHPSRSGARGIARFGISPSSSQKASKWPWSSSDSARVKPCLGRPLAWEGPVHHTHTPNTGGQNINKPHPGIKTEVEQKLEASGQIDTHAHNYQEKSGQVRRMRRQKEGRKKERTKENNVIWVGA